MGYRHFLRHIVLLWNKFPSLWNQRVAKGSIPWYLGKEKTSSTPKAAWPLFRRLNATKKSIKMTGSLTSRRSRTSNKIITGQASQNAAKRRPMVIKEKRCESAASENEEWHDCQNHIHGEAPQSKARPAVPECPHCMFDAPTMEQVELVLCVHTFIVAVFVIGYDLCRATNDARLVVTSF